MHTNTPGFYIRAVIRMLVFLAISPIWAAILAVWLYVGIIAFAYGALMEEKEEKPEYIAPFDLFSATLRFPLVMWRGK